MDSVYNKNLEKPLDHHLAVVRELAVVDSSRLSEIACHWVSLVRTAIECHCISFVFSARSYVIESKSGDRVSIVNEWVVPGVALRVELVKEVNWIHRPLWGLPSD